MTTEPGTPRSRRALLSAALGAGAATVAAALGRPAPARAANGGSILLGTAPSLYDGTGTNEASQSTYMYTTSGIGLEVISAGTGGGLIGYTNHPTGTVFGVYGQSDADAGIGVKAWAPSASGPTRGVLGVVESADGTGVQGYSGPFGATPAAMPRTGVHGAASQDGTAVGVRGDSAAGAGVVGFSGTGALSSKPKTGVYGQSNQGTAGVGVRGHSTAGIGVHASTGSTGTALRATGRVKLDNCAGVAIIAAGTKSVVVNPGIDLVSTSAVVATLQGNPGGTTTVQRVAIDTTAGIFTIHLTANSAAAVKVAWHVFG